MQKAKKNLITMKIKRETTIKKRKTRPNTAIRKGKTNEKVYCINTDNRNISHRLFI